MAKYVKKPYVIEAVRFDGRSFEEKPAWLGTALANGTVRCIRDITGETFAFEVETLEGNMRGNRGAYLVKGVDGELYPCKGEIFEKTYDCVEDRK